MSGAKKTFKRIATKDRLLKELKVPTSKKTFKDAINPLSQAEDIAGDVTELFTPEIPEPEEQTIIPIPDERSSELKARKRRARAKTSGRQSTILTEGLGG